MLPFSERGNVWADEQICEKKMSHLLGAFWVWRTHGTTKNIPITQFYIWSWITGESLVEDKMSEAAAPMQLIFIWLNHLKRLTLKECGHKEMEGEG
jgi:hypothetical protein